MIRWQKTFGIAGAIGLAISLAGLARFHDQFFESYLFAFVFWFGLAIGSLGLIALHWIVGGAWGRLILPLLESAAGTLPWLFLLFVPLFFGLPALYPWARPALVASLPILQHRHVYLNAPFFDLRVLLHFVIWSVMAALLARRTLPSSTADALTLEQKQRRGGLSLVIYFITLNLSVIDWVMSVEVSWYSTIFGVLAMMLWVLSTLAFMICALAALKDPGRLSDEIPKKAFWDLGNLTFAFVMLWAYMTFSQYLIIWSGNRPDEISWYLTRQRGPWFYVAMALVVFEFFFPFFYLLMRRNKQRLERLVIVGGWIFGMTLVNQFWIIKPSFTDGYFRVHWLDATAWVGVGGIWLAIFIAQLRRRPVLRWLDDLKTEAA